MSLLLKGLPNLIITKGLGISKKGKKCYNFNVRINQEYTWVVNE